MIGQRFGRLVVLSDAGRTKDMCILYLCQCDCGNKKKILSKNLRSGLSTSCGCYAKEQRRKSLNTVKIGNRYGRLVVLSYIGSNGKKASLWNCKCDCGNEKIATSNHLTMGNVQSCGCLHSGPTSKNFNPNKTSKAEKEAGRKTAQYFAWRFNVYKRDNFLCQVCNTNKNKLNAHHIVSYATDEGLRLDLNNGITLCEKCHKEFHKIYGKINCNIGQLKEFKSQQVVTLN